MFSPYFWNVIHFGTNTGKVFAFGGRLQIYYNGLFSVCGFYGFYWSTTENGYSANNIYFRFSKAFMDDYRLINCYSVIFVLELTGYLGIQQIDNFLLNRLAANFKK